MYRLIRFELVDGIDRRIVVVTGPTVGPCIVEFLSIGGNVKGLIGVGTRYKIWHGVDAE